MRGNTKKFALKSAVAVAATAAMVVPMAACGSGTAGGGKNQDFVLFLLQGQPDW